MKLFELVGVKAHYDKTQSEIINLIQSGGKFIKAGDGHFAIVFKHESGVAYKFWAHDPMYEKYIDYCNANHNNKHLPKFKSKIKTLTPFFKRSEHFPDKIKYVKLEILQPYDYEIHRLGNTYYDTLIKELTKYANRQLEFESEIESTVAPKSAWGSVVKNCGVAVRYKDDCRQIYDTLLDIIKNVGPINDLHNSNMMMRGDILVITDPIANLEDIRLMSKLYDLMRDPDNLIVSGRTKTRTTQ